jgi:hypothetical protein
VDKSATVERMSGTPGRIGTQPDAKRDSTPAVGSTGGAPLTPPPVESLRRAERMDPTSSLSERLLWHGYGLDEELGE